MASLRLISTLPTSSTKGSSERLEHPCLVAFQRETDYVLRTLRRLGVSPNDVEDLAQEVFLVLHQSWERYDQSRPLRAYLFGIAFRVVGNYTRKRRREILFAVMEGSAENDRPDQALEASRTRALVLSALNRVPLQRRAVLIMHDVDKLPMSAIAESLSIYRFTGYSRLRKARKEFAAAVTALLGGSEP
jgi:RNA polymerase sigma-70 factor, ECF subfamily